MPRYTSDRVGTRDDFVRLTWMPSSVHTVRSLSLDCKQASSEETRMSQSSREQSILTPLLVKDGGNRSHNPRENLGRSRQTEIKDPELVCLSLHHESKVATRIAMNRNLQVGVLQIQGDHPVAWTDGAKD